MYTIIVDKQWRPVTEYKIMNDPQKVKPRYHTDWFIPHPTAISQSGLSIYSHAPPPATIDGLNQQIEFFLYYFIYIHIHLYWYLVIY